MKKRFSILAKIGITGILGMAAVLAPVMGACADESVTMENAPVIKVAIPLLGTKAEGDAAVVEKINEILVEKAGAVIDITWTDFGNLQQQINMMLTNSSELDIGYIFGGPRTYANNGQLYDMTEFMEAEGEGIVDLIGE